MLFTRQPLCWPKATLHLNNFSLLFDLPIYALTQFIDMQIKQGIINSSINSVLGDPLIYYPYASKIKIDVYHLE